MKNISLLIFFCLVSLTCVGQDIKAELLAIQEQYDKTYFSGVIESRIYNNKQDEPAEIIKTAIKKSGNQFLYAIKDNTVLINKDFVITLQKAKQILVCNINEGANSGINPGAVDQLLEHYNEVTSKGIVDGQQLYVLKNPDAAISTVELYVDLGSQMIHKMVYHYPDDSADEVSKVELLFKEINLAPNFPKELFSIKNFVQVQGNKIKPLAKYKDYTLVLGIGLEEIK